MYYKIRRVDTKPYLVFDVVAMSDEELIVRQLCEGRIVKNQFIPNNPIELLEDVYQERDLPVLVNGVYEVTVDDDGVLEALDPDRLKLVRDEYRNDTSAALKGDQRDQLRALSIELDLMKRLGENQTSTQANFDALKLLYQS